MNNKFLALRIGQLVVGSVILGTGAGLLLIAGLGMDPYGILLEGTALRFGVSFGTANVVLGLFLVLFCWRFGKIRPGVGSFLSPVLVGLAAESTLRAVAVPSSFAVQLFLVVMATGFISVGAGMYLSANLGKAAFDSVPFAAHYFLPSWSLSKIYFWVLAITFATGFLVGGTVGIATPLLMVVLGPMVVAVKSRCDMLGISSVPA